jgi:pimeloyl-ACP methyl ester carboxylesterase
LPSALSACGTGEPGWRALPLSGQAGIDAAARGHGPLAVVFANESGASPCGWLGLAGELVASGHPVAVTDGPGDPGVSLDVFRAMRSTAGARTAVIIGASVGGRAVIKAAARHPSGVVGIVSISGERTVSGDQVDLLPAARRVRLPVLFVGSRQDGYTDFGADTRALHRAVPAKANQMLLLSGGDHGVDLLADDHGTAVRTAIERFVSARSSPGPS